MTTLTFYSMGGCPYCQDFEKTWRKINEYNVMNNNKYKLEKKMSENVDEIDTINGEPILGFPTIALTIGTGSRKKKFKYSGPRTFSAIMNFVYDKEKELGNDDEKIADKIKKYEKKIKNIEMTDPDKIKYKLAKYNSRIANISNQHPKYEIYKRKIQKYSKLKKK